MTNYGRKFIFSMFTVVAVTGFFIIMHYDAENYSRTIIGIATAFLVSQAAVDWKTNVQQPPGPPKP